MKYLSQLGGALALVATTTLIGCQNTTAFQPAPAQLQAQSQSDSLSNRVVVGYRGQLSGQKLQQMQAQGFKLVRNIPQISIAVFERSASAQLNLLSQDPQFTFSGPDQSPRRIVAQPQYVQAPRNGEGDPLKKDQWSLKAVGAEEAWKMTRGSKKVIAAVVDTGVDLAHPDLKGNLVKGYNAENPNEPPQDGHYHGTHVAGIIAAVADNGQGVTGIAPNVNLMPIRAISRGGVAEVADGIVWAADHGADVINLSLGWDYPSASVEETIQRAVKYALNKNVVICAALSNSSRFNPRSTPDNLANKPGFEGVIGVGNVDINDKRNGAYGDWKSVSSPGTQIMSTLPNNRYGNLTGTSMATPMVTGIVALMRSVKPNISNVEIKQALMKNAVDLGAPGMDDQFGAGRVNAFSTLTQLF